MAKIKWLFKLYFRVPNVIIMSSHIKYNILKDSNTIWLTPPANLMISKFREEINR